MYSPGHYQISDEVLQHEVIHQSPFATVISGEQISHLPLYLHEGRLISHMARANPHWKIGQDQLCLAIFHGPHAYISPSWYTESIGNVPTWNYVVVHAQGVLRILENELAMNSLQEQIRRNEGKDGWFLPEDRKEIDRLFKSIVVFEITDLKLEGKFKLSQKQDPDNKRRVIAKLEKGNEEARKVAALMTKHSF